MPFFLNSYFYFIPLALQAFCAIHCFRRGTQQKWIWVIIFLPVIGSLIYLFSEVFTGRSMQNVQTGLGSLLNPSGSIRRLEENLRFTDTFNNRVALADAYLATGMTDQAIGLYEGSLTGAFTENEHVLSQLIIAYFVKKRYEDLIPLAGKIRRAPQFARSRAHLLYAVSLGYAGRKEEAEKEFKSLKSRFSQFEARYEYGLFLARNGREQEARILFREMIDEAPHLSSRERRESRAWVSRAAEELRRPYFSSNAS